MLDAQDTDSKTHSLPFSLLSMWWESASGKGEQCKETGDYTGLYQVL